MASSPVHIRSLIQLTKRLNLLDFPAQIGYFNRAAADSADAYLVQRLPKAKSGARTRIRLEDLTGSRDDDRTVRRPHLVIVANWRIGIVLRERMAARQGQNKSNDNENARHLVLP